MLKRGRKKKNKKGKNRKRKKMRNIPSIVRKFQKEKYRERKETHEKR